MYIILCSVFGYQLNIISSDLLSAWSSEQVTIGFLDSAQAVGFNINLISRGSSGGRARH